MTKAYTITQIKSMLQQISPYPWRCSRTAGGEYWVMAPDDSDHEYRNDYEPIYESSGTIPQLGIDGQFIAEAPQIIEHLLERIKTLHELLQIPPKVEP